MRLLALALALSRRLLLLFLLVASEVCSQADIILAVTSSERLKNNGSVNEIQGKSREYQ